MTVDPPKADFHLPSRFAAGVAKSDINAHRHCEFILGTAPISGPPRDNHPVWLGEEAVRKVVERLRHYPSEGTQARQVSMAVGLNA